MKSWLKRQWFGITHWRITKEELACRRPYWHIFCDSSCEEDFGSKCYCKCGHEILQDPLSKIYEGGTFTNIICSECNRQSTWDLNTPVPLFIREIK